MENKVLQLPKGDIILHPVEHFGRLKRNVKKGIPGNDSDEEGYFDWWIAEMKNASLVDEIYQASPITLLDEIRLNTEVQLKTKTRWDSISLLPEKKYLMDRVVKWNKSFRGNLKEYYFNGDSVQVYADQNSEAYWYATMYQGDFYSFVDIKPPFQGKNAKTPGWNFRQHLSLLKLGIYIQPVVLFPSGKKKATKNHLFPTTFTPLRFTMTDGATKRRVIHFEVKTIDKYKEKWHL